MKPIENLKKEHDAVKITLRVLNNIVNEAEKTGQVTNPDHLEQLIEFFRTFVDKYHHSKEEELLFPALEEVGVSKEGGPIGVMLNEHKQGRDYVAKMNATLVRNSEGDHEAISDPIQNARAYIDLLSHHIEKENNVLFSIADKHLSGEKQVELGEGFEAVESQKIGAGKHDAFHRMLESLEKIYLQ